MSTCSSEDFMESLNVSHRRSFGAGEEEMKRTKKAKKNQDNRKQSNKERVIVPKASLETATKQEQGDIEEIMNIQRSLNIRLELRIEEAMTVSTLDGMDWITSLHEDEEQRMKILACLRERKKYQALHKTFLNDLEPLKTIHYGAYNRYRIVAFVLGVQRRTGMPLPSLAALSSHLFYGRKGVKTTKIQMKWAGVILLHTIRMYKFGSKERRDLTTMERAMLDLFHI